MGWSSACRPVRIIRQAQPRRDAQRLPKRTDGGIFGPVLLMCHVAVAPVIGRRLLIDNKRFAVSVNVVNDDVHQIGAGRVILRVVWIESAAVRASAFDDGHEVVRLIDLIVFQVF